MAQKKSPKARRPLDRDGIERAALRLIDDEGLAEFSMRHLGKKLGVEAMSLYHHYPSKAHLLDALLDRLIATLPIPESTLPWRERILQICVDYRALAAKHPKFAPFMIVHRMNTRTTLAWLESMVRIIGDAGFDAAEGARAFRVVGYFLMGTILDESSGYAGGPSAAEKVPDEEQARIAPTVARFGPYFAREHWDATFRRGLDALLDDLERRLAERARAPRRPQR